LEAAGEVFSYVEDAAPVRRLSKEGSVRRLSKDGISEFQGDDVSYQSYAAAPPRWEEHVNVAERARKWRLSFEEVQGIVDGFRAADRGLGLISREDLFTVFKTTDWGANVPDKIVLRAWTAIAGGSDSVPWIKTLDAFLEWYRANIFGPITLANQSAEESLTYELARKMQEMPQTIDSLRRRFHEFDTDGSGQICYDEFLLIMCKVMGIKDASLTCDKRFQRYWREADTDGSGEISFEEFCFWYLNNFHANGQLPYQKPS
jgi:Ca2+-binding EF-hand superfamily protein